MGFWTFLLGVPPVRAAGGETEPEAEAGEIGGGADGSGIGTDGGAADLAPGSPSPDGADGTGEADEGPRSVSVGVSETDGSEEPRAAGLSEIADTPEDTPEDAPENIFKDEIGSEDAAPLEEDEDSRLLDTLMAVGAEVDQAKAGKAEMDAAEEVAEEAGTSGGDDMPEAETDTSTPLALEDVADLEPETVAQSSTAVDSLMGLSTGHKNDEVRATLAAMGDDGSAPRHVIHFAYATEGSASQQAMADELGEHGFDVVDADEEGAIRMEHTREVASADFDAFTDLLEAELDAKGWQYDGWECAVAGA